MLWKHSARGDEKAFMTVRCVNASSITLGSGVTIKVATGASFDGTQAVLSDSAGGADLTGFVGIAVQDIAVNAYGLVQTFGFCASVLLSNVGTSITIAFGNPLIPSPLAGALSSAAPTYAASGFGYVIASNVPANTLSVAAPLYASGYVRCVH